jgi:F420H(2)-dependent quinone reductase
VSNAENTAPTQTVRTLPRSVLGAFWLLHRALYRFSGGRIGLSRPKAGGRFGMMRLTTLREHVLLLRY